MSNYPYHQHPVDSLDLHQEQFNRSRMLSSSSTYDKPNEHLVFKNFYKKELDDILQQKNKNKMIEKLKQEEQRKNYNERLRLGQQAQRIKQISYKNYYQMILNNQENIKNKYISPFQERDQLKNKLIDKGFEEGKIRNQLDYEREIRRQENIRREFQNVLHQQVNEKQLSQRRQVEEKSKTNEHLRNVLLTPQQVNHLQREKKLVEMNKYKEDLDRLTNQKMKMSRSQIHAQNNNPEYSPIKLEKHNLLLNPLPYNIQNPYILKQMQRKNMLSPNSSSKTINNIEVQMSPTKRNIF